MQPPIYGFHLRPKTMKPRSTTKTVPRLYFADNVRRLAYLTIPKSACTSCKAFILSCTNPELHRKVIEGTLNQAYVHSRHVAELLAPSDTDLERYFTFTFVRNPYDRLLSFYRTKVRDNWDTSIAPTLKRLGIRPKMPFDELVARITDADPLDLDRHLIPQHMIAVQDNAPIVDFLGKVEKISSHFEFIRKVAHTDRPLAHLHNSGRAALSRHDFFNKRVQTKLWDYYKTDFEFFNYPSDLDSRNSERRSAFLDENDLYIDYDKFQNYLSCAVEN